VCDSYTTPTGGTYFTSQIINFIIPNAAGCDSLVSLDLTVLEPSSSITVTSCDDYTSPSGVVLTTSQIFIDTIPSSANCDSIITINLTITTPSSSITVTSCDDYTSPSGVVLTTSQIFIDTIPSSAGCDSIITIDLTITTPSSSITETSCGAYTSPSGIVVTTSQIFTDTISSVDGCDSTITIDLTIVEINDSVTSIIDSSLISNEMNPNATFQWYDCDNNFSIEPGATGQSHVPNFNGFFAVVISLDGCIDTSDCVEMIFTNTQNQYLQSTVNIFPNPTNGDFTIDLGTTYQDIRVEIYSIDGKLITNQLFNNQQEINAKIEAITGLYQVRVKTEKGVVNKMILKE
ncbi:MAG: T9SS type A sorting domain-containing protein, partial [Saprospiraceae bacterium]